MDTVRLTMQTSVRRVAVVLAMVPLGPGCTAATPSSVAPPAGRPAMAIADADQHGAILIDGRTVRGVQRDGTVAWQIALDPRRDRVVGCLPRCPDAAFSSVVPGPGPAARGPWFMIGDRRAAATGVAPASAVLTAAGQDDLVVAHGGPTRWWLALYRRTQPVQRIPIGGSRTEWQESADGRVALAITRVGDATSAVHEARWFERDADGWRQVDSTFSVAGAASCVSPDGTHALLLGSAPMVVGRDGNQRRVTELDYASACTLATSGGLVADYQNTTEGSRARLRAFNSDGDVVMRRDLPRPPDITAGSAGGSVAYVAGGELRAVDIHAGAETRTLPNVSAARYAASGDLVVVTDDGRTSWLVPSAPA